MRVCLRVLLRWPRLLPPLMLAAACGDDGPSGGSDRLIEILSESAVAGTPLDTVPAPLEVLVTDLAGRPLSGMQVTWSTPDGGSLLPESPATDDAGTARAAWVLGWRPGEQEARAASGEVEVAFTATAAGFQAASLSIGDGGYQCGITDAGAVYCWGPDRGDIGGTTDLSPVPVAVALDAPVRLVVTTTYSEESACALTTAGEVWCWGDNATGQLGNGTLAPSPSPVEPLLPPGSYKGLSANQGGICAAAEAGDAYCWGNNTAGRLGLGHEDTPVTMPSRVAADFAWRQVSLGDDRACGVRDGGQVYCWGRDPERLGIPSDTNTTLPLPVTDAPAMDSVTLSGWHQCGLAPDRVTYCWGTNFNIGFPSSEFLIPTPMPLATPPTFQSVHSVFKPTFALGTDAKGYWWGPPPHSTGGGPEVPVPLGGDIPLRAIGTFNDGVCGVEQSTGTVYCWAQSAIYELGRLSAVPLPTSP